MSIVRSLGQIVLYTISCFLIIIGVTTMAAYNNNWILVPIGIAVMIIGYYFKKQLAEIGL